MINILRSKGYKGGNSIESIIKWLSTKHIYVDIITVNNDKIEYRCKGIVPPYNIEFTTLNAKSRRDALTIFIYSMHEYIPSNINKI